MFVISLIVQPRPIFADSLGGFGPSGEKTGPAADRQTSPQRYHTRVHNCSRCVFLWKSSFSPFFWSDEPHSIPTIFFNLVHQISHCASISGGSSLLLHLVSAVAVAGADIRPLLLVLEMRAQPLEVHHLFRCLCSALLLLVVRLSNPPLHRHRRHHLCSNPAVIAWFGLLARYRRVPLNAILRLQLLSFL
jgi:hypothetical protein